MKATLELTGTELVLLYIATGNESAGALIHRCLKEKREFDAATGIVAQTAFRSRRPKAEKEAR